MATQNGIGAITGITINANGIHDVELDTGGGNTQLFVLDARPGQGDPTQFVLLACALFAGYESQLRSSIATDDNGHINNVQLTRFPPVQAK